MTQLTLESLAKRLAALEQQVASMNGPSGKKDWRKVVGIVEDTEFARNVIAEGKAIRQADRDEAARDPAP